MSLFIEESAPDCKYSIYNSKHWSFYSSLQMGNANWLTYTRLLNFNSGGSIIPHNEWFFPSQTGNNRRKIAKLPYENLKHQPFNLRNNWVLSLDWPGRLQNFNFRGSITPRNEWVTSIDWPTLDYTISIFTGRLNYPPLVMNELRPLIDLH